MTQKLQNLSLLDFEIPQNLETEHLQLQKAKTSHLKDLFNNFWSDEQTAKNMLWKPCKTLVEAKKRLEKTIEWQTTHPWHKNHLAFVVVEKESEQAVGIAGFNVVCIDKNNQTTFEDTGVGFGQKFTKKGYGTELMKVLIDVMKNTCKAKRVVCRTCSDNLAACKLFDKFGFKKIGEGTIIRKWDSKEMQISYFEKLF